MLGARGSYSARRSTALSAVGAVTTQLRVPFFIRPLQSGLFRIVSPIWTTGQEPCQAVCKKLNLIFFFFWLANYALFSWAGIYLQTLNFQSSVFLHMNLWTRVEQPQDDPLIKRFNTPRSNPFPREFPGLQPCTWGLREWFAISSEVESLRSESFMAVWWRFMFTFCNLDLCLVCLRFYIHVHCVLQTYWKYFGIENTVHHRWSQHGLCFRPASDPDPRPWPALQWQCPGMHRWVLKYETLKLYFSQEVRKEDV